MDLDDKTVFEKIILEKIFFKTFLIQAFARVRIFLLILLWWRFQQRYKLGKMGMNLFNHTHQGR
jgi:hypothetical protein